MKKEDEKEEVIASPQEKSKKELLIERLKTKYSDLGDEEDSIYERIGADYDQHDKLNDEAQKLSEFLSSDPKIAQFFNAWRGGDNIIAFLLREYGEDIKLALNDEDKIEEYANAHNEYIERVAKSKKLDEDAEKNLTISFKNLEELQKENNLTDEQVDAIWKSVYSIILKGVSSIVDKETYIMVMKALAYDQDVTEASLTGEIKGRNEKIIAKKKSNEEIMPTVLSGASAPYQKPKEQGFNPFKARE